MNFLFSRGTVYSNWSHGEVRLSGGCTLTQGRIEICIDGVWGSGIMLMMLILYVLN